MSTPTLPAFVRQQLEQRERQMQTSFPAKVISYDSDTGTVTVEPQFIETWRDADGTRVNETIENKEDAYVANVPVLFPQGAGFRITFPIAANDWGLVHCTKYSLDLWRQQGSVNDPGDLRRFTMSGAVFEPVNLQPDADYLKHDGGDYISLSFGGTVDFVALKQDVEDIKSALDHLESKFNTHQHVCPESAGSPTTGNSNPASHSYTVLGSTKVKVE